MNPERRDEELQRLLDERYGEPPAERFRNSRKTGKNTSTHKGRTA